jgi:putative inorganic carbon (HCO3(-)) transporter
MTGEPGHGVRHLAHRWGAPLTLLALAAPAALLLPSPVLGVSIPTAVIATGLAISAALHPRTAWWAVIITAPVSIALPTGFTGAEMSAPVEALILGLALAWVLRMRSPELRPRIAPPAVPLALVTVLMLSWSGVAAVGSSDVLVAVKTVALRLAGAAGIFGWGLVMFEDPETRRRAPLVGLVACSPVAVWALVRLAAFGVDRHASPQPFFPNRLEFTILCSVWLAAAIGSAARLRSTAERGALPALCVVALASRAAWAALAAGLAAAAAMNAARRPHLLPWAAVATGGIVAAVGMGFGFWWTSPARAMPDGLEAVYRQADGSIVERDESVLERLNRWGAAIRMGAARPVTGFGPGTFERRYAAYQDEGRTTRWTTPRGDLGDAHSELFSRLAEEGLPGAILWVAWLVATAVAAASSPSGRPWAAAIAALGTAGLVAGLSDIPALSAALWITAAGAAAAAGDRDHGPKPAVPV